MEDKFITLTWGFIKDKNTTMQEKFILAEIQNLSVLELGCVASNEHFAEMLGVKKESISRSISSLEKKGYITSDIKNGSRNFGRKITLNKLLFHPKQNVISPLTNCLETKGNNTSNKTINKYEAFIAELKAKVSIKSKVTKTKEGEKIFKSIKDKQKLVTDYVNHQLEKKEYAQRITAFMEDYNPGQSNTPLNVGERRVGGFII